MQWLSPSLYCYKNGGKFTFGNDNYNMHLYLYVDDIKDFLSCPNAGQWGCRSRSNSISTEDIVRICEYLRKYCLPRYKTVTAVIKSRSKRKQYYLNQFPLADLIEYVEQNKKEETAC